MTRLRMRGSTSLALVLILAGTPAGRSQGQSSNGWEPSVASSPGTAVASDSVARSYKVYSLDELESDPGFGEWIAQTIPEVIATGTWKGPGVIRYYAPKNILVVCHTAAVQAKVDGFLKDVKKTLADAKSTNAMTSKRSAPGPEVVQTAYPVPNLLKVSSPTPEPKLSYPVPAQAKTPKHLFHFIIRYEGDGIIDDSVVRVMKSYFQAERKAAAATAANPMEGALAEAMKSATAGSSTTVPPPPPSVQTGVKADKKESGKGNKKKKEQPKQT